MAEEGSLQVRAFAFAWRHGVDCSKQTMTSWNSLPFEVKSLILKHYIDASVAAHTIENGIEESWARHNCSHEILRQMRDMLEITPEMQVETLRLVNQARDKAMELNRGTYNSYSNAMAPVQVITRSCSEFSRPILE